MERFLQRQAWFPLRLRPKVSPHLISQTPCAHVLLCYEYMCDRQACGRGLALRPGTSICAQCPDFIVVPSRLRAVCHVVCVCVCVCVRVCVCVCVSYPWSQAASLQRRVGQQTDQGQANRPPAGLASYCPTCRAYRRSFLKRALRLVLVRTITLQVQAVFTVGYVCMLTLYALAEQSRSTEAALQVVQRFAGTAAYRGT